MASEEPESFSTTSLMEVNMGGELSNATGQSNEVVSPEWLRDRGFSFDVARALVGREVTYNQLRHMTARDIFDHYLSWNGIIGYTFHIESALDNIREAWGVGVKE